MEVLGWAPTEAAMLTFLQAMDWIEETDDGWQITTDMDLDPMPGYANACPITVITTEAVLDKDGEVVEAAEIAPGWHFNMRFYGGRFEAFRCKAAVRR